MVPPIVLEVEGATKVKFSVPLRNGRRVRLEGIAEPLFLGVRALAGWGTSDLQISQIFVGRSQINWLLAGGVTADIPSLITAWENAIGIGEAGMTIISEVLRHSDLVESDFQAFYGLDLREWLIPAGKLSTRRMVALLRGLRSRPESLFWSEFGEIDPMTRGEILLAQLVQLQTEKPHPFLTSRKDREEERVREEKMQRMKARGLTAQ